MSWYPTGFNLLSNTADGRILTNIIASLVKELARMQAEIDELKKGKR